MDRNLRLVCCHFFNLGSRSNFIFISYQIENANATCLARDGEGRYRNWLKRLQKHSKNSFSSIVKDKSYTMK